MAEPLVLQHLHQFGDASDPRRTFQVRDDRFGGGQDQLILVRTVLGITKYRGMDVGLNEGLVYDVPIYVYIYIYICVCVYVYI